MGLEEQSRSPLAKELRSDRQRIGDSGWWDIQDEAWAEIQETYGGGLPANVFDYKDQLMREKAEEEGGRFPGSSYASQIKGDDILSEHADLVSERRQRFLEEQAEIAALLTKWGYSGATSQPFLGMEEGGISGGLSGLSGLSGLPSELD
jgi:hypothetical protein